MKRAGSAYMSGIAAAAGLRPRGTKLLRPPLRLYGSERVLASEQTKIGESARSQTPSAPAMPASAGPRPPVIRPVAAKPGQTDSPLTSSPSTTPELSTADAVSARVATEMVPAPTQPPQPDGATRPKLERAEATGEPTLVSPPALERQSTLRPQPPERVAAIRRAESAERSPDPAAELATTVAPVELIAPVGQPAPIQAAPDPRVLTLEPSSTIAIGPQAVSQVSPTPVRPSARQQQAPTVQIGVIDVTVLPAPAPSVSIAPQAPSPARTDAGAPLSRGVGSWYGLAQR